MTDNDLDLSGELTSLRESNASAAEKLTAAGLLLDNYLRQLTAKSARTFTGSRARAVYLINNQYAEGRFALVWQKICRARQSGDIADLIDLLGQLPAILSGEQAITTLGKGAALGTNPQGTVLEVGPRQATSRGRAYHDLKMLSAAGETYNLRLLDCSDKREDTAGRRFHLLAGIIDAGLRLRVLDADYPSDDFYVTTPHSRLVLEPDFLMDVSSLAECFFYSRKLGRVTANPLVFLYNKYKSQPTNEALWTGKLVNFLLDGLLADPQADPMSLMAQGARENWLFTAFIPAGKRQAMYQSILDDHLASLRNFCRRLQDTPVSVEPSYLAPLFGLQGRLDVLAHREPPLGQDIYELKSSTPPGTTVWPNHRYQVTGYMLLLEAAHAGKRRGVSAILYSRGGGVRDVEEQLSAQQRLLSLRNFVVGGLHRQAGTGRLELPIQVDDLPPFMVDEARQLGKDYHTADELTRCWFDEFSAFLLREIIAGKSGDNHGETFSALWNSEREEKEKNGRLLAELNFAGYNYRDNLLLLDRPAGVNTRLRVGDAVLLYPWPEAKLDSGSFVLKGFLQEIDAQQLAVKMFSRPDERLWREHGVWALEPDYYDRGVFNQLGLLTSFLQAAEERRALVLGQRPPRFEPLEEQSFAGLSTGQNAILNQALAARDYFLVQGPPGTGKTSTFLKALVSALHQKKLRENQFIITFTNRAADEITDMLEGTGLNYLRLGREGENSFYRLAHQANPGFMRSRVQECRIFVATAAAFSGLWPDLGAIKTFDTLIVDEASQLTEPQLAGLTVMFRRFYLVGDQNQLPAVVVQHNTQCLNQLLQKAGYHDFAESMFARLMRRCREFGKGSAMLFEHYRLHQKLADLINPWYDNNLVCGLPRQNAEPYWPVANGKLAPVLAQRLVFWDSPVQTELLNAHKAEAERAIALAIMITKAGLSVGIMAPFRAQTALINSLLPADTGGKITVDTVERFQGSEVDAVIFSFAVSRFSQMSRISSLAGGVDRKLNVALSRAREMVVMLGRAAILRQSPIHAKILAKVKTDGLYLEEESLEQG